MNRMENPGNHAATCGLGGRPCCQSEQTVIGMTCLVDGILSCPVAWCAKSSLKLLTQGNQQATPTKAKNLVMGHFNMILK